ncbi:MAG: D-aminoacylase [Gemmatimonadaceae bacterium]|nr:D-aminoacylase [Gemmatimonadaceae bacterium]
MPSNLSRVFAACATICSTGLSAHAQAPAGTLIRNALVIDGRGTPARRADVRVVGDRITAVGQLTPQASERVVDAKGLALAPGFIDTHSHHDRGLFDARSAVAMVSQGVTTIVVGQDGGGMNLGAFFARLDSQPVAVNVASYVGHGAVRRAVLGDDFKRRATAAELARMQALVRTDMAAGALGLSTGLEYDPGIYSAPEEVMALAKVAGDAGGRYISHIRSEDRDFWPALNEVIAIGRANHMPVQVSHIKLGMLDLWGQADSVVHILNRARASGVQVTADIYPYLYWQSNLGVFYPKRNFSDSAETAFILAHLTAADDIIFNSVTGHPEYRGKTLAQIAVLRGKPASRTMMDLLAEPGGSGAGVVAKGMDDRDVATLMQWPFTNICSDGMSSGLHPRGFGSFPKVLGPYVRDRKLFPVEEAVRKMTSLAAANVGLVQRGMIAPGFFADLVLFDPATVTDHASFETPQAQATGIHAVWVNGAMVFDVGKPTGRYAGRALRRAQ